MLGYENSHHPILPPARPWSEFFGTMKLPPLKNIAKRFEDNALFYQTNYLIIGILCLGISIVKSPIILLVIPTIALLWWLTFIRRTGEFVIFGLRISKNFNLIVLMIITAFLVFYSGSWYGSIFSSAISSVIISFHACLRCRNVSIQRIEAESKNSIFNPEELLRKDHSSMPYHSNTSNNRSTSVTSSSYIPGISNKKFEEPDTNQSPKFESSANESSAANSTSSSVDRSARRMKSEALRQKQKEMRQRIREQYQL